MHDPPQRQRFREQVRYLIARTSTGRTSASVSRGKIEEDIGASLGMKSDEAYHECLTLHGMPWTTRTGNMEANSITSDESRAYPPSRSFLSGEQDTYRVRERFKDYAGVKEPLTPPS